jgi:hypothetical protein
MASVLQSYEKGTQVQLEVTFEVGLVEIMGVSELGTQLLPQVFRK